MRSAHTTRRHLEASFDGLDVDVFALQDVAAPLLDDLAGDAVGEEEREIDALIASVDRELAAEAEAAITRVTHSFTDARSAHRTSRRAGRTVLRSLPSRIDDVVQVEGKAA
jgi:class 3 adenylate cyclase